MPEINKKASERLTEINRALDILRKEGAPVGDVDKILKELEEKVLQEEVCPSLREAVTPLISLIGHKVSLRIDYAPGSPIDIRIDENFAQEAGTAEDQECREDEGERARDEGEGEEVEINEDGDDVRNVGKGEGGDCFIVRNVNGELVLDMPTMYEETKSSHQNTLLRTLRAVVDFQKDFFMTGRISALKPMTLKDLEAGTELDNSTLSRALRGKEVVIVTDYGRNNLKYFFSEGIKKTDGKVSSHVLEEDIKNIIKDEDKEKPLTDDEIVNILVEDKDYVIARRTVAKYRMQLGIPVAKVRNLNYKLK